MGNVFALAAAAGGALVWYEVDAYNQNHTTILPESMKQYGAPNDYWGFVPSGAGGGKTTHAQWAQLFQYGQGSMLAGVIPGSGTPGQGPFQRYEGISTDMLNAWGTGQLPEGTQDGGGFDGGWSRENVFPTVIRQPTAWAPFDNNNVQVCDHQSFPNCQMSTVRDASAVVRLPGTNQEVVLFDEWMNRIDKLWEFYSDNGTEYLSQVNQKDDTSTWDPCSGAGNDITEIEVVVTGVVVAAAVRIALVVFVPEANTALPLAAQTALTLGPFAAGYFYAQWKIGNGELTNLNYCTDALLYTASFATAGAVGGMLDRQNQVLSIAFGAGGGYLLTKFLGGAVSDFLRLSGWLPGLLLKLVKVLAKVFATVKCDFDFADAFVCLAPENNDNDTQHSPSDRRRWDYGSIAALLTDRMIAKYKISGGRSSKEAEFIYRGLLTGFDLPRAGMQSFSNAPTVNDILSDSLINPVGDVIHIGYEGNSSSANSESGQNYRVLNLRGWDGSNNNWFNWDFWKSPSENTFTVPANLYMCNKWDVIMNDSYGDKHGQDTTTGQIMQTLMNASEELYQTITNDPAAYNKMKNIPGVATLLQKEQPPPPTLLAHPENWKTDPLAIAMKSFAAGEYMGMFKSTAITKPTDPLPMGQMGAVVGSVMKYAGANNYSSICMANKIPKELCKAGATSQVWLSAWEFLKNAGAAGYASLDLLDLAISTKAVDNTDTLTQSMYLQAWAYPFKDALYTEQQTNMLRDSSTARYQQLIKLAVPLFP